METTPELPLSAAALQSRSNHTWLRCDFQQHVVSELGSSISPTRRPYYAVQNQFERFRGFLELISRFEFDFLRRENYFFERFEFLVCSKFNHTHHVAVHVPLLWPVCAHTIPFRMLWCLCRFTITFQKYTCKRCCKKHETIVEGHKHIHVRIDVRIQPNTHTRIHLHAQIHVHVHNKLICVCAVLRMSK